MSNPCPEILQSAELQVALGKGKRERHYGKNHFLNQFIKLFSSNVESSWQQNREMAYSDAGHQVTYPVPRKMWSTTHGPGVSTMKPQVTERKLLLLTSIWLHSNTFIFKRSGVLHTENIG